MKWVSNIVFIAIVLLVSWVGYARTEGKVSDLAIETHASLCAFKLDLERRHEDGVKFVDDVKAGKRPSIPGITIAELQRSIDNQRRTLDSLAALDCL